MKFDRTRIRDVTHIDACNINKHKHVRRYLYIWVIVSGGGAYYPSKIRDMECNKPSFFYTECTDNVGALLRICWKCVTCNVSVRHWETWDEWLNVKYLSTYRMYYTYTLVRSWQTKFSCDFFSQTSKSGDFISFRSMLQDFRRMSVSKSFG